MQRIADLIPSNFSLTLNLEGCIGDPVAAMLWDAYRITQILGLAYATFDANGQDYTVYRDSRALRFAIGQPGRYETNLSAHSAGSRDLHWKYYPPIED